MDAKSKLIIVICSVFAILALAFYIILGFFKPVVVNDVTYPSGNLSQSVFDSQNMSYVPTQGLDEQHYFRNVPYTMDTVVGPKANIADGSFYNSEPYYFYYSEALSSESTVDIMKKEITDILSLTAEESSTQVDIIKEENGYINGCTATYYVVRVAAGESVAHMCLYRMHINDDIYSSEYDLFAGVMSRNAVSTESVTNLYTLANATVYTLQYSKETQDRLNKEEQERLDAEKKAVEEQPEATEEPSKTEEQGNSDVATGAGNGENTIENANDLFKTP